MQRDTRFLVVGRAGMDLAPDPAGTAIEAAVRFEAALGGSAANIAVGLARLECEASLLSAVSRDPVGDYCIAQLRAYGVDAAHVARTHGETRTSLALTEARVENHRTIIYRNNAADLQLSQTDVEAVDFGRFSHLVLTGTALAVEPSRRAVLAAIERARASGLTIVLDIDYRPYSWAGAEDARTTLMRAAEASHIIAGNEDEFELLAGTLDGGEQVARDLASAGPRLCLYKRGPDGCTAYEGDERSDFGTFPTTPLKPTGAGDSFLAALLATLSSGGEVGSAVTRGAAAAAMVVARPGCAPAMPTPVEIDHFIAEHGDRDAHSAP